MLCTFDNICFCWCHISFDGKGPGSSNWPTRWIFRSTNRFIGRLGRLGDLPFYTLYWTVLYWHLDVYSKLTIIGPDNGLPPCQRQAIIWTNAGILLIGQLGTNFSDILIEIQTFSFKNKRLEMSSAKWWPFCLGLNVLMEPTCSHISTFASTSGPSDNGCGTMDWVSLKSTSLDQTISNSFGPWKM